MTIIIGVINILTFIFLIFPSYLEEVRKMDRYQLIVLCIFIACIIYWLYFLIISKSQHRNLFRLLMNLKENPKIIRNSDNEYWYLIEENTCSHIPDPETLAYLERYLGFSQTAVKVMTTNEIERKFKIQRQLPSIRLHFPETEPKQ